MRRTDYGSYRAPDIPDNNLRTQLSAAMARGGEQKRQQRYAEAAAVLEEHRRMAAAREASSRAPPPPPQAGLAAAAAGGASAAFSPVRSHAKRQGHGHGAARGHKRNIKASAPVLPSIDSPVAGSPSRAAVTALMKSPELPSHFHEARERAKASRSGRRRRAERAYEKRKLAEDKVAAEAARLKALAEAQALAVAEADARVKALKARKEGRRLSDVSRSPSPTYHDGTDDGGHGWDSNDDVDATGDGTRAQHRSDWLDVTADDDWTPQSVADARAARRHRGAALDADKGKRRSAATSVVSELSRPAPSGGVNSVAVASRSPSQSPAPAPAQAAEHSPGPEAIARAKRAPSLWEDDPSKLPDAGATVPAPDNTVSPLSKRAHQSQADAHSTATGAGGVGTRNPAHMSALRRKQIYGHDTKGASLTSDGVAVLTALSESTRPADVVAHGVLAAVLDHDRIVRETAVAKMRDTEAKWEQERAAAEAQAEAAGAKGVDPFHYDAHHQPLVGIGVDNTLFGPQRFFLQDTTPLFAPNDASGKLLFDPKTGDLVPQRGASMRPSRREEVIYLGKVLDIMLAELDAERGRVAGGGQMALEDGTHGATVTGTANHGLELHAKTLRGSHRRVAPPPRDIFSEEPPSTAVAHPHKAVAGLGDGGGAAGDAATDGAGGGSGGDMAVPSTPTGPATEFLTGFRPDLTAEISVWGVVLAELVRQSYAHCEERGMLMERVRARLLQVLAGADRFCVNVQREMLRVRERLAAVKYEAHQREERADQQLAALKSALQDKDKHLEQTAAELQNRESAAMMELFSLRRSLAAANNDPRLAAEHYLRERSMMEELRELAQYVVKLNAGDDATQGQATAPSAIRLKARNKVYSKLLWRIAIRLVMEKRRAKTGQTGTLPFSGVDLNRLRAGKMSLLMRDNGDVEAAKEEEAEERKRDGDDDEAGPEAADDAAGGDGDGDAGVGDGDGDGAGAGEEKGDDEAVGDKGEPEPKPEPETAHAEAQPKPSTAEEPKPRRIRAASLAAPPKRVEVAHKLVQTEATEDMERDETLEALRRLLYDEEVELSDAADAVVLVHAKLIAKLQRAKDAGELDPAVLMLLLMRLDVASGDAVKMRSDVENDANPKQRGRSRKGGRRRSSASTVGRSPKLGQKVEVKLGKDVVPVNSTMPMTSEAIAKMSKASFRNPDTWIKFLGKKKIKGQLMPLKVARQLIMSIIQEKIKADAVEVREGAQADPMHSFVINTLLYKFGTKGLVQQRLANILATVKKQFFNDRLVRLFGRFVGITATLPLDCLTKLLVAMGVAFEGNMPTMKGKDETLYLEGVRFFEGFKAVEAEMPGCDILKAEERLAVMTLMKTGVADPAGESKAKDAAKEGVAAEPEAPSTPIGGAALGMAAKLKRGATKRLLAKKQSQRRLSTGRASDLIGAAVSGMVKADGIGNEWNTLRHHVAAKKLQKLFRARMATLRMKVRRRQMIQRITRRQTDVVDFMECFVDMWIETDKLNYERAMRLFKEADDNGDGVLEMHEFESLIQKLYKEMGGNPFRKVPSKTIRKLFMEAAMDSEDGAISPEKFGGMVREELPRVIMSHVDNSFRAVHNVVPSVANAATAASAAAAAGAGADGGGAAAGAGAEGAVEESATAAPSEEASRAGSAASAAVEGLNDVGKSVVTEDDPDGADE